MGMAMLVLVVTVALGLVEQLLHAQENRLASDMARAVDLLTTDAIVKMAEVVRIVRCLTVLWVRVGSLCQRVLILLTQMLCAQTWVLVISQPDLATVQMVLLVVRVSG
jgi:hypothetical protein